MAVNRLNVGATNQLLAKASTGQSTNILELQGTAGTTLAGVDASGNPVGTLAHPPTFKNLIINGAMQVAQRGTSVASITTSGYNTADRWAVAISSLGTWTNSVENDGPTGSGFRKSLKMLCTTADASPAAGDYLWIYQGFEGQNLQSILKGSSSAKQLTLSFWVKSNVTGTYIAELADNDNSRQVSLSYSVSASATWEKKTITFPADTTGVLDNDNNSSIWFRFYLGAGTTYTSGTLATSWQTQTGNTANRAVGQTNLAAATNNYWQITGVQLEVGSVVTEFEFKPIDVELAQCQRYYWKNSSSGNAANPYGLGFATTTTAGHTVVNFPVTMRSAPSAVEFSTLGFLLPGTGYYGATGITLDNPNQFCTMLSLTGLTGLTANRPYVFSNNNSTSGFLAVTAEL